MLPKVSTGKRKTNRESNVMKVGALSASSRRGHVQIGTSALPCALGRAGSRAIKREGDGATPIGVWPIRCVYYRADRIRRPVCGIPVHAIRPNDGWCDATGDRNYNRPVRHPYPVSAERLWRDDHVYDIVVVLGHNDRPRKRGCGSAIFMHLARDGYTATEGCVAMREQDLRRVLATVRRQSRLVVGRGR